MGFFADNKIAIASSAGVGAAAFAIGRMGRNDGKEDIAIAMAIGAVIGGIVGAGAMYGIKVSRGVGAIPYTPIFASLGIAIPLAIESPSIMTGGTFSSNGRLIRNAAIGGAIGTAIGVAIDYYNGQL